MRRNFQMSLCERFIIVVVASSFSVSQAATFYNQTYNNVFERGISYRGNDRASKEFRVPESLEQQSFRKSKLFPLFTIIRFSNEVCRTTSEETGICYTRNQCNNLGGLPQGSCASGLGVCCRFIASCGAVIYQNSTSFQNPNYPSKYAPTGGSDVCQVRIKKSQNVCQLKLNFIVFDVEGPSSGATGAAGNNNAAMESGVCKIDSLAITSSGASVPSLCGNMNGQHLYVDFGSSDTITLNLLLGGNNNNARERTWNIEILTIPCNSVARAPTGCLQYYTGVSGMVESFNYQGGSHLANLDYSICVRLEDGMRFIDWSPCAPNSVRFGGGTAALPTGTATNMPCLTGGPITGQTTLIPDYLVIPQGVSYPPATGTNNAQPTSTSDRFCDLSFIQAGSYVRSSAKPFFMHIRTDSMEGGANDATSQGLCLRWQQNPQ